MALAAFAFTVSALNWLAAVANLALAFAASFAFAISLSFAALISSRVGLRVADCASIGVAIKVIAKTQARRPAALRLENTFPPCRCFREVKAVTNVFRINECL